MAQLNNVLKTAADLGVTIWHFSRFGLLAVVAALVGIWIGLMSTGSKEAAAIICSALVIILYMLIVLRSPLDGFLVWIFFNTFIDTWIKVPLGAGIPDLSFGRFAVAFLAISLLMRVAIYGFRLKPLGLSDLLVVVVPLCILQAVPLAVDPIRAAERTLALHIIPLAGFFFARHLIRNRKELNRLLWVIAIFGMLAAAHALIEGTTGHILITAQDQEIKNTLRGSTNMRLIVGLIGGTGAMGRVLAITLLVTTFLFLEQKNIAIKRWLALGALLQFGGIFITFSRTPLIGCTLGLLILQFFFPPLRRILLIMAVVVGVGLAITWDQFEKTEVAQDRVAMGTYDLNDRSNRWQVGYAMWSQKPVRGWGHGRFEQESGQFRTDGLTRNVNAVENDYLYILLSAGLIGFIPHALFLLNQIVKSVQLYFRQRKVRNLGFVRPQTLALFWAVMACFILAMFTAINSFLIMKLLPLVIAGAIVGSQEHLLRRSKREAAAFAPRLEPSGAFAQH